MAVFNFLSKKVMPPISIGTDGSNEQVLNQVSIKDVEEFFILIILFFLRFVLQQVDVHCYAGE